MLFISLMTLRVDFWVKIVIYHHILGINLSRRPDDREMSACCCLWVIPERSRVHSLTHLVLPMAGCWLWCHRTCVCFLSEEEKRSIAIDQEIRRKLKQQKQKEKREIKILLLGQSVTLHAQHSSIMGCISLSRSHPNRRVRYVSSRGYVRNGTEWFRRRLETGLDPPGPETCHWWLVKPSQQNHDWIWEAEGDGWSSRWFRSSPFH